MRKNILKNFFILYFFFFFKIFAFADDNKIVAKINDKIITSYEVKNKINTELVLRNLEINQFNIDKIKGLVLQNLINSRIKESEIEKYKSIKIEDINITNNLKIISSGNINKLKEKFQEYDLNYEIFIKELKLQMAWQKLIIILFQDKVQINDDEILSEIKDIKAETANIKMYDLSEIESSFISESDKEEKIKKIKLSINDIGFDQTVSIFSESISASNKGKLGFVNEESLSKDVYKNLKSLKKGDISEPIIQRDKITFLRINNIKILENQKFDIEKIKKNLIAKKKNNLLDLYSQSHLSKLRNSSFIELK